jgi:hypothetical protein
MYSPPCHHMNRQCQRGDLVAFLSFLIVMKSIG